MMLSRRFWQHLPIIAIAVVALMGALTIAYATHWGPWVGTDSVEYVEAARNLAAGKGLVLIRASGNVVPLYLRPPFYSIVLAGFLRVGLDTILAGRIIDIVLFFCLFLLPGLLAYRVPDRYVLPLSLSMYLLSCFNLVSNFTGLMSEPLFILLILSAIGLAAASLLPGRRFLLWLAAAASALATLTRFAGAACILVVALAPFLYNGISLWRKIGSSLAVMFIGVLPVAIWTVSIRAAGYTPGISALPTANLWQALQPVRIVYVNMLWKWFCLPLLFPAASFRVKTVVLLLICVALVGGMGWLVFRLKRHAAISNGESTVSTVGILLLLFAAAHAVFVAISYLTVTLPKPSLDPRVLLPSQVAFVIGVVLVLYASFLSSRIAVFRLILPLVLLLASVGMDAQSTWQYVEQLHTKGADYTSQEWQQSPILNALRNLSPSLSIASNDIDAVTFFAQRPAFRIPELEAGLPLTDWTSFGQNPQSIVEKKFAEGEAVLVLFTNGRDQFSKLYGERTQERLFVFVKGLYPIYQGPDGAIYLYKKP
jgi:hypothetical protein